MLQYPGYINTYAYGINNRGEVVGSFGPAYYADRRIGFRYSNGTYTTIEYPGADITTLRAINDHGQIVGWEYGPPRTNPGAYFLYEKGTFTVLPLPGAPLAINNRGEIVGNFYAGPGSHGYVYAAGVVQAIDAPVQDAAGTTQVFGINDRGEILGTYNVGGVSYEFIEQAGNFSTLPISFPGGRLSFVQAINNRGEIVGTYATDFGWRGFVYYQGQYTSFTVPQAVYCLNGRTFGATYGQAINDRGQIAGFWTGYENGVRGYIATPSPQGAADGNECAGAG